MPATYTAPMSTTPSTHSPAVPDSVYAEAVAALFARQPNRMVPDLDRITTLVELLGRPDQAYPAIQLTGTNGKTSTTHMIACLLGGLGLSAGSYTSPHLQDVRERIRVATTPLSRGELVARLDELAGYLAEVDTRHAERVTFFEVLTALAFAHFADAPVDVGLFEVGLGGRWDATNLARGEVAVIGRVALDHPELGSTLEQVAAEKAGIVKEGATVVSAAQDPAVTPIVADAARRHGGRLVVADEDFAIVSRLPAVGGQLLTLEGVTGRFDEVFLPLSGAHQARNAAVALAAVEGFLGFAGGLDPEVIREGFAAVRSAGRLELVARTDAAPVLLDGAHNPAGMRALVEALRGEFAFRHRVVVLGILGDKDIDAMVAELLPATDHLVVTEPPSSRAASADRVAKIARAAGGTVEVAPDVATALDLATGLAGESDAVVVTGSLYTVGAARDALGLDPA
ncbi:folylpolyglutamate synthase/dihydrofolate synthase family protein [soil metagenome]